MLVLIGWDIYYRVRESEAGGSETSLKFVKNCHQHVQALLKQRGYSVTVEDVSRIFDNNSILSDQARWPVEGHRGQPILNMVALIEDWLELAVANARKLYNELLQGVGKDLGESQLNITIAYLFLHSLGLLPYHEEEHLLPLYEDTAAFVELSDTLSLQELTGLFLLLTGHTQTFTQLSSGTTKNNDQPKVQTARKPIDLSDDSDVDEYYDNLQLRIKYWKANQGQTYTIDDLLIPIALILGHENV